jgi:hypothetical protein
MHNRATKLPVGRLPEEGAREAHRGYSADRLGAGLQELEGLLEKAAEFGD